MEKGSGGRREAKMGKIEDIRLITAEDIPGLKYRNMDWDVVVYGKPYQVIQATGFVHTIGGRLDHGGGNDYWAYPLAEEMTVDNLIEFDGHPGACWGMEYAPANRIKTKWDETEILKSRNLCITRNGEKFYDGFMTFHQAIAYIKDGILDDHPLYLNKRDYDKKCVGRKVWWKEQPARIRRYIYGRACVELVPDGIPGFERPKSYDDDWMWEAENKNAIVDSIFSDSIGWFRG